MSSETEIRPFRVEMPGEAIADLRRRVASWRPPEREPVDDQSQGVQLATVRDLANYWATEYDWRRCEAKLNALPQFTTEIDGLGVRDLRGAVVLAASHNRPKLLRHRRRLPPGGGDRVSG